MLSVTGILVGGLVLSTAIGGVILGSLIFNARLWLQDYPAEIRARVVPLTDIEKRHRAITGVLLMAAFFVPVMWSLSRSASDLDFVTAYLHAFAVFNIGNLFDAVVIDFLILAVMQPKFAQLPGTEDLAYLYRDWGKHLSAYLKGIIFCAIMSLPVALIAAALF